MDSWGCWAVWGWSVSLVDLEFCEQLPAPGVVGQACLIRLLDDRTSRQPGLEALKGSTRMVSPVFTCLDPPRATGRLSWAAELRVFQDIVGDSFVATDAVIFVLGW